MSDIKKPLRALRVTPEPVPELGGAEREALARIWISTLYGAERLAGASPPLVRE